VTSNRVTPQARFFDYRIEPPPHIGLEWSRASARKRIGIIVTSPFQPPFIKVWNAMRFGYAGCGYTNFCSTIMGVRQHVVRPNAYFAADRFVHVARDVKWIRIAFKPSEAVFQHHRPEPLVHHVCVCLKIIKSDLIGSVAHGIERVPPDCDTTDRPAPYSVCISTCRPGRIYRQQAFAFIKRIEQLVDDVAALTQNDIDLVKSIRFHDAGIRAVRKEHNPTQPERQVLKIKKAEIVLLFEALKSRREYRGNGFVGLFHWGNQGFGSVLLTRL